MAGLAITVMGPRTSQPLDWGYRLSGGPRSSQSLASPGLSNHEGLQGLIDGRGFRKQVSLLPLSGLVLQGQRPETESVPTSCPHAHGWGWDKDEQMSPCCCCCQTKYRWWPKRAGDYAGYCRAGAQRRQDRPLLSRIIIFFGR